MPADFDPTLEPTKNIGAFKFWCQTTLPAVYDESLSYYELLCKVVATLNEVITNNNAQNENVDALHAAYQQLQTYVNDYFTNLDVQDEINNKLDTMAKDGTLATLIAGVIGSVTPIFVDSTASMTNTTKIYVLTTNGHIYAYNGSTFFDTGLIYNSDGNNTILTEYETTISDSWFSSNPSTKIESLPINYIYRVYLNATNGLAFGLPQEFLDDTGANNFAGTLYIFQPFDRANISTQQYRNYIFTGGGNSNVSSWQALDYEASTTEHIWFRLSNNFNVINYNNKPINNGNLNSRTVLTLKPNNAYNFSLNAENTRNFGIPYTGTAQCSGQVIVSQVYSTYNRVQPLSYRVLTAIYGFGQANTNISFALMFGDSTIQKINWMTIATDENLNNLKEIALTKHGTMINADNITTILDLEPNQVYALMVGDNNPEQFGLPADCVGTGTLIILRGLTSSNFGYTTYIYICDDVFTRMYYALLYNYAASISDIHWQNVFATNNTPYRNLGTSTNNIYLLGDSIVEGYGGTGYNGGAEGTSGELITNSIKTWYRNTAGTCWANEYKSYIEENYPNTTVTNNGIGGLTSAQLLSTIDDLYTANSIVIVGIGTNDRNNSNSNGLRTYNNIRHIIKNLMLNDCTPIILTNTPVLPNESSKGKPNIITQAIKSAADKYNVLCVDVMTEFLSYIEQNDLDINDYYADYLHPNDAGYKLMFNIIRAKIGL